jgi:GntR family transcriptional regulator of abcA and norABC
MIKSVVEINWQLDKKNNKPAYVQISDYISNKIKSGEWTAGSFLPSQRELAKLFKVNRSTVVTALDELRSIGLLETNGKGGTKVAHCQMPLYGNVQPDWQSIIEDGIHMSNLNTIQVINRHEFSSDLIRLSSGEASPELFPAEKMVEVLAEVGKNMKSLGYEEPKGMPYLREQVCLYLKDFGIITSPANVLIVSGALQAIQLISLGLLQPGSTVFLEKPSYLYSLNIFQSIGMRRCGIGMDSEGIRAEDIPKQTPKHRQSMLYTIPNYHNPTGIVMSKERRSELLKVCSRGYIPIIEDDVYRELWIDKRPPAPIKSMDEKGAVLYVGSISKTLSTGLRIGWIVGPEAVVDRLGDIKMQTDYGSSSLAQLAVGKWMETGCYREHNSYLRQHLAFRRQAALLALETYFKDIAEWNTPEGGYYIWVEFKYPIRMNSLFDEAFKKGILTYPGYLYDSVMNQCLRISYSYASISDIRKGIRILAEIAKGIIIMGRD